MRVAHQPGVSNVYISVHSETMRKVNLYFMLVHGPFPERIGDIGNHVKNCVHILQ